MRRMPSGYGKDLAGKRTLARARQRCERYYRKPPDVVLVVHHGDERGVAGRRALDQTNLTVLCRGCHQLEHGRGPPARRRPQVRCPV
jgi:5-methylcytosine-specific restriction endonuclease McrA